MDTSINIIPKYYTKRQVKQNVKKIGMTWIDNSDESDNILVSDNITIDSFTKTIIFHSSHIAGNIIRRSFTNELVKPCTKFQAKQQAEEDGMSWIDRSGENENDDIIISCNKTIDSITNTVVFLPLDMMGCIIEKVF